MDKVLIVSGGSLLWLAATDRQQLAIDNTGKLLKQAGFLSTMGIYAGLLSLATYSKPLASTAAAIGFIIAFGVARSSIKE